MLPSPLTRLLIALVASLALLAPRVELRAARTDPSVRDSTIAASAGASAVSVAVPTGTTTGDVVVVMIATNLDSTPHSDNNGSAPFSVVVAAHAPDPGNVSASLWYRVIDG